MMNTGKRLKALLAWAGIGLLLAAPAGGGVGVGMTGAIKNQGDELDEKVAAAEARSKDETITISSAPTGPIQPVTDVTAVYSTSGGSSSLGHALKYSFRWGDGTFSDWSDSLFAGKAWPKSGSRAVQVQAVCVLHKNAYCAGPILRVNVLAGIRTVAGNGSYGAGGDGGLATSAPLGYITGLAMDSEGNIFISDIFNNRVRRIDAQTGIITRFAGTGTAGYLGDGGSALLARLYMPMGLAVDSADNLYIADMGNNVIRKVDSSTGTISTVAGTGAGDFYGDGGAATSAHLFYPASVYICPQGHMYICDLLNSRIRKVNGYSGIIETIAGTGANGYNGDGIPAATAELNVPYDVKVDATGDVYIADSNNHRVRRIDAGSGLIHTFAGNGSAGSAGEGIAATAAELSRPWGLIVGPKRHIYINDMNVNRVRRVDTVTGIISTVAGAATGGIDSDDIAATAAQLTVPKDGAVGSLGELIISDYSDFKVRRVAP